MSKGAGGTKGARSALEKNPMASAIGKLDKRELYALKMVQAGKQDELVDDSKAWDDVFDARKDFLSLGEGKYTQDELDAISAYSGYHYDVINQVLEKKDNYKVYEGKRSVQEWIKNLDSAIAKTKLPRDMVVYRGTPVAEKGIKQGFISTSRDLHTALQFNDGSKNVHAYLIPKGTHVIYIRDRAENEILLPRGYDIKKHRIL